jgi:hypothetical protein
MNSFEFDNDADDIILFDASGMEQDRVQYNDNDNWNVGNGRSMALELPGVNNNDPNNWCLSTAFYGPTASPRDQGTPGVKNDCPGFNPP